MVSRWTVYHAFQLKNAIKKGLLKKGFSFIEVISPCTTGYGRLNKMTPIQMMNQLKDNSRVAKVHPTEATIEPEREIIIGNFVDVRKPTYDEVLAELERNIDE